MAENTQQQDVVIVGGGVAGCAAAIRLARAGYAVTVLEKETGYVDRVRGECMVHWGYEQAIAMGIADIMRETPGASFVTRLMNYDEIMPLEVARARGRDVSQMVEGVPGLLCVGHVDLRERLANEAVAAGAAVLRGVLHIEVEPGARPTVTFQHDGAAQTISAGLVMGADGRESRLRSKLGIALMQSGPRACMSGMLVDDGGAWDRAETTQGVFGDNMLYVMPRGNNLSRLYVARTIGNPNRLIGKEAPQRMLDCFDVEGLPFGKEIAQAKPMGPCASFITTDSWTSQPFVAGVVLMGDAAGWCNPVTGQGLSIALRDARIVTDLFLEAKGAWSDEQAREYGIERTERMRRLRYSSALMDLVVGQGVPDRLIRLKRMSKRMRENHKLVEALEACHIGPWNIGEEAFTPSNLAELAMA